MGPIISRQDCICNFVALRIENRDHWSCKGDPLRHRPTSPVANIRLSHLERLLRHPACPLCCAAAIAGIAILLVSARALPLLGGILATLAIGGVGPWIAFRSATALIAWDRRRCRVADTLTATITWRSILPWWRLHVSLSWRDAEPGPRSPGSPAAVSTAATIDSARDHLARPSRGDSANGLRNHGFRPTNWPASSRCPPRMRRSPFPPCIARGGAISRFSSRRPRSGKACLRQSARRCAPGTNGCGSWWAASQRGPTHRPSSHRRPGLAEPTDRLRRGGSEPGGTALGKLPGHILGSACGRHH